jgi:DNA-binding NarL/FixJ family response regulator
MAVVDERSEQSVDARTKVLIVEEQEVLRRGLVAIASSIPEVVGSVAAVSSVPSRDARVLAGIGITLLSTPALMTAQRNGFGVEHLHPRIVILPTSDPQQLEIATRQSADGYILQAELATDSLRTTLLQVLNGQLAISDEVAAHLLNRLQRYDTVAMPPLSQLSAREAEVLDLLVAGASNKEIANKLRISVHGAKRHVSSLLSRFHSPNRVHLVSRIVRSGMTLPSRRHPT